MVFFVYVIGRDFASFLKPRTMATLTLPQNGQAMKGPPPFFMLTTSLSKSQAMDIAKPVIDVPDQPYPASRTLTLILGKQDKIVWYRGEAGKATPQQGDFKTIHAVLAQNQEAIAKKHKKDPAKFMIVIIKPTEKSNYKNFVDALDEMAIAKVKSYLIDDDHLLGQEAVYLKEFGM